MKTHSSFSTGQPGFFLLKLAAIRNGVRAAIARGASRRNANRIAAKSLNANDSEPRNKTSKQFVVLTILSMLQLAVSAQSLWKDDASKSAFADKRATGIGDILTIVVQETTSTSKDNKTATSKSSGVDASISSFLYSPAASGLLTKGGKLPALKFDSKNDYSGGGSINNSEKLLARIAVKVIDVLPNKNLVVEGRRETSFSGESQTVILRGVVRSEDVAANNTIFSYNLADASIQIVSKGTISDTQKKGWFTRVWDKISPF